MFLPVSSGVPEAGQKSSTDHKLLKSDWRANTDSDPHSRREWNGLSRTKDFLTTGKYDLLFELTSTTIQLAVSLFMNLLCSAQQGFEVSEVLSNIVSCSSSWVVNIFVRGRDTVSFLFPTAVETSIAAHTQFQMW